MRICRSSVTSRGERVPTCYDPLAMKAVDTSFFCILTNHSYTGHVRDSYAKNNSVSCHLVILLFCYPVISFSNYPEHV